MELLTVKEAAKWLKLSHDTLRRLLREGKVAGEKVGGQWRVWRLEPKGEGHGQQQDQGD